MRIHTLDLHFQNHPGTIASYLIEGPDGLVLIETGPGSTYPALVRAIGNAGFATDQISAILLTHIHLDHSGAAGQFAKHSIPIYVHPRGARHLIDPSVLIASATMVYGDRMNELWGEILPYPESLVHPTEDNTTVEVCGLKFTAWDTPGHARHHLCWILDDIAFTGDVAGARLQGTNHLSLTSAPPQFEVDPYLESINRLLAGNFTTLYPTHFGSFHDVTDHLTRYRELVTSDTNFVRSNPAPEAYATHCHQRALADGLTEAQFESIEAMNPTTMCHQGISLHLKKIA